MKLNQKLAHGGHINKNMKEAEKRKENITLIDADSLIFYSSKDTIEVSLTIIKNRITEILDNTEADKFILFLTGGKQGFRYNIYPEYKQNRKKSYGKRLKYLKTLKAFLIEEYNACLIPELEADDLVAYYSNNLPEYNTVISSPDKDVLYQLVGKHWNYKYIVHDKGTPDEKVEKGSWVTVDNQTDANRFLAIQLIMGDSTDNIKGIETRTDWMRTRYGLDKRSGLGLKTAEKIVDIIDKKYGGNYSAEILNCYISKYGTPLRDKDPKAYDEGFGDYTLNRKLLQLHTELVPSNYKLEFYNIEDHIQNYTIYTENEEDLEHF